MSDPEEAWKPVARDEDGREYPGYEVSDHGNYRSVDRTLPSGRRVKGRPLTVRTSNRGYGLVDLRDADGNKVTRSAHKPVLETHHKHCPPGMEARHLDDNGLNNRFVPAATEEESRRLGGNLWWGTREDNHRDKVRNGGATPPPPPQHDCVGVPGHPRCDGKVANEGKRCMPCVDVMGAEAAQRLTMGENLLAVAQSYGYKGPRWTYQKAVEHGYKGTEAEALTQKRGWLRRVTSRRGRRSRGDAPSQQVASSGGRKPRPRALRAVSPQQRLGQSRTSETQNVAERDVPKARANHPEVTERDHIPYPADLTQRDRPRRRPGGVTGRSR